MRREVYKSLGLNPSRFGSTLIEFPVEWQNIPANEIGRGCLGKETKKRCLKEMGKEMSKYVISTNVDLELRLSPPGVGFRAKSSHQSETSPLPSPETCILLDLNSRNHLDNSFIVGVPSLSLMGCSSCLIYVMVSEADPKCPKCKSSSYFVDVFRDNPDKEI